MQSIYAYGDAAYLGGADTFEHPPISIAAVVGVYAFDAEYGGGANVK